MFITKLRMGVGILVRVSIISVVPSVLCSLRTEVQISSTFEWIYSTGETSLSGSALIMATASSLLSANSFFTMNEIE